MKLSPIQELKQSKLEWFLCECGNAEFTITQEYLEPGEPQLGVVQQNFDCKCGASYVWEYGEIRTVQYGEMNWSKPLSPKVQELINRKPLRWANVNVKTFKEDIQLLTSTVETQHEQLETVKAFLSERRALLKSKQDSGIDVDYICDEITALLKSL